MTRLVPGILQTSLLRWKPHDTQDTVLVRGAQMFACCCWWGYAKHGGRSRYLVRVYGEAYYSLKVSINGSSYRRSFTEQIYGGSAEIGAVQ